ncbi:hypothetical protein [Blastochloris tepida]|jgi:hypothetical protein|uniref:SHOCT domain-containing protein n=1 Tax=Blastochloris tepida TaxID=2233851 RepID=A0A348G520_9HYPH|nr:hypothetical protein [Blastochloris tepida]BBF94653.1 hypothetical protein BLTE_33380 [Blastochloris tepida]
MANKDTFKFSTFLWLVAGLLIPFWPISLPLCWFFAYRSYKSGTEPVGSMSDLTAAIELHKQGLVSNEELEVVKRRTIGSR